jgi:hypothetical protein
MPNGSIDDNGEALDDLDLGTTRTGLSDFDRHYLSHNACLASDDKQVFVMGALDHDIP